MARSNAEIIGIIVDSPSKLPPMPGNYGSVAGLTHHGYLFPGETEAYKIHHAAVKRLGLPYMNVVDFHDYLKAHPEHNITITEVTHYELFTLMDNL